MKDKIWHQSAIFENSWPPFCQIWIIFTHLKVWIASARHNFKWGKFRLNNLAVKGLKRWILLYKPWRPKGFFQLKIIRNVFVSAFWFIWIPMLWVYGRYKYVYCYSAGMGGGPRVVVSTAAFHARVRGSVPGLGGLKETKMFLPHPRVKVSIVGSLRDREVACSASDRQGSNLESCVWRTVSSQSSHHPQEVLLAQFSLYVHKGGLKPDSFHFLQCGDRL